MDHTPRTPHDLATSAVGEVLRHARASSGLTATAVAAASGTSRAALHSYETGARMPGVDAAARVLAACGYTLLAAPLNETAPGAVPIAGAPVDPERPERPERRRARGRGRA